jgi:hypothetical protein
MLTLLIAAAIAAPAALPASLSATEARRVPTTDANQGVASDGPHLYAIDNRAIAQIDAATGKQVARWDGDPEHYKHLNSCIVEAQTLICAASNYPETSMAGRIERFDIRTMRHIDTREMGGTYGSLTWVDHDRSGRHKADWWACYANYDAKGGVPGRDHRATTLVRYDKDFREIAHWTFPDTVLDRFAPRSSSGGAWGKDGLLYVTGHDRPELYVLRVPNRGSVLEHVATIAIPTGGQAIGWDAREPRLLWSIERSTKEVVASHIPPVIAGGK